MLTPDARIARLAERQHGVFTYAQAIAAGLSATQIARRTRNGRWVHVHRGVYRIRGSMLTFEGQAHAAVLAAGRDAFASHETAAGLWNLDPIPRRAPIHISVRDERRVRIAGVTAHRPRSVLKSDVTSIGNIPVTTLSRTVIDLSDHVDKIVLEDALDDVLRRGWVEASALLKRVQRMHKQGRRGLRALVELLEERVGRRPSGSRRESELGRLLVRAGFAKPVAQHNIYAPDGAFVARVDYAYPDAKVAIEFDGYANHSSRKRWESDRVRQNRLVALGWHPVRISDRQMHERPDEVLAYIERTVSAVGFGSLVGRQRRQAT